MKLNAADIKRFLTKTSLFSETQLRSPIRQVKISHPLTETTLVAFVWNSALMGLLFDEYAQDDVEILAQVKNWGRPARLLRPTTSSDGHFMHDSKVVYLITSAAPKTRLDQKLVELEPAYSRSQLIKFIRNGYVLVNGAVEKKASLLIAESDVISLEPPQKIAQNFEILFENSNLVAINKPTGVLSHHTNKSDSEWTIDDFAKLKSQIGTDQRAIAHRLDRDTSGVMLAAKTNQSLEWLQQQFAQRKVEKTYYAIVDKEPPHQQAVIDLPLERSLIAPGRFEVSPNGREATTAMKVVGQASGRWLLELKPKTGRTHQLRVHLSHIGCPIVGDRLYGGTKNQRLLLHAGEIRIADIDGQKIEVIAPLPEEMIL